MDAGFLRAAGRRTWLLLGTALLMGCALLVTAIHVEREDRETFQAQQRNRVRESLVLLQSQLAGHLRSDLLLVRGLVSVIAADPRLDQARFAHAARPLFGGNSQLRNIGAAPDMVIRLMYPLAGNEKALGLDYRKSPEQAAAAERARATREIVVAGPLGLVQGGSGLIARIPVYLDGGDREGDFWGLVSAVIDADRLWRDSGLLDAGLPVEVALRGRDGTGETGAVFFGSEAVFADAPETVTIALPTGSWQMAARPRGGWQATSPDAMTSRLAFAALALLILVPLLLLVRYDLRQRAAERRLVASEERLSLAIGAAQLLIWDWNPDTGALASNRLLAELLGLPAETRHPTIEAVKARMHPEDIGRVEAAIEAHLSGNAAGIDVDFRLGAADGAWRWCRGTGRIVQRSADGRPQRVSGVLQDISALRAAHEELVRARVAAEAGSRAKSEFLATMSHEIRTPMNGVLGMAELLRMTPLDAEQAEYVTALQDSGRSLLAIINDILDFSKIEAGRLTLESIDFDLAALVQEACALLRPGAAAKGLLLEIECPADLPRSLRGDAQRIRQVLVNLVGNAIKFTRAGRIDVEIGWRPAEADAARVHLAVRDTGIGIPAAAQARLFDAFSQLDASTTRRYGGTGLGLSISRSLVEAMGGRIGVVSAPDEGACFWFELNLPRGKELRPASHAATADRPRFRERRVLLVEDNPANEMVACRMLEAMGIETVCAENGRIGVELFAAGHFDLVLMDVRMPEMDGIEATQAMRALQLEGATRTPIVAVTADAQAADRERCLSAGMSDFLAKPYRQAELTAMLERWLG